jgi:hypothetical protein
VGCDLFCEDAVYACGRGFLFGWEELQVDTVDAIKQGLAEMDDGEVRKMAGDLFELTMDDERGEE